MGKLSTYSAKFCTVPAQVYNITNHLFCSNVWRYPTLEFTVRTFSYFVFPMSLRSTESTSSLTPDPKDQTLLLMFKSDISKTFLLVQVIGPG